MCECVCTWVYVCLRVHVCVERKLAVIGSESDIVYN